MQAGLGNPQRTYTVCKPVWETKTREVCYTVCKPVWETKTRDVHRLQAVWETKTREDTYYVRKRFLTPRRFTSEEWSLGNSECTRFPAAATPKLSVEPGTLLEVGSLPLQVLCTAQVNAVRW